MKEADAMAQREGLPRAWVRHTIGQARYMASIAKAVLPPPPGVAKNWTQYRNRFVEPVRIRAGVRFWQDNRSSLERAEAQFGVPPEIIVGILGVESIYGRQMGEYRTIDALCTLAFDFPAEHPRAAARRAYFLSELQAFLALTARNHANPLTLRSSYAGAMGWPQFMPSSWARYAVDFDGDGRVDLFHSPSDIVGSVAHYFQAFHWQPGMPVYYPARLDPAQADLATLLEPDIRPTFSAAQMGALGVTLDDAGRQYGGPLALIELQNGDAPAQYVAGTGNFYAITRYNWSAYYAMAVTALGEAVRQAMNAPDPPNAPNAPNASRAPYAPDASDVAALAKDPRP